ncbi:MAG: GPW/gp25 family protein [Spirulina sp.]
MERDVLFGQDLLLHNRFGGLDLGSDGNRDLGLATGYDNAIQALTLRLRVRQGELAPLGWPTYGSRLHELIGTPNTPPTHLKLMAYARAAITADPRVAEIVDIQTQVIPGERNTVRLLMDIRLIDSPTPLNLVFDLNLEAA